MKKINVDKRTEVTQLDSSTIKRQYINLGQAGTRPAEDHPYVVYVINRCNWVIVALVDTNGNAHPYSPPIVRTCASDFDTCKVNGQYAAAAGSDCTATQYRFALRCTHPKGYHGDTHYVNVNPDCNYAGEVIDFNIPDPA